MNGGYCPPSNYHLENLTLMASIDLSPIAELANEEIAPARIAYLLQQQQLYRAAKVDLLPKYRNLYIAFENGLVLDSDASDIMLMQRLCIRYGHRDLLVVCVIASEYQLFKFSTGRLFPNCFFEILTKLKSKIARLRLASDPKTNPEILAEIAITEKVDEDICCAVASNISTPLHALKYLLGWRAIDDDRDDPYIKVYEAVINNPMLPISILEELLDIHIDSGWLDLLMCFSKLSRLNTSMIEKLSEKFYPNFWLIDHPLTQNSPELLDKIARHCREKPILNKVLNNSLTSSSTLEYLAGYPDREIRNSVIAHQNASTKALDIVLLTQGKQVNTASVTNEKRYSWNNLYEPPPEDEIPF
jgi:hypothetical protein